MVICAYQFTTNYYVDRDLKIVGAYADLHDANVKVAELWKDPSELICGKMYRERARDGKENDGKLVSTL